MDQALVTKLAIAFSKNLLADIGAADLQIVDKDNAKRDDDSCASHDYIDANDSMAQAFEEVVGREIDLQSEEDRALWGAAWTKGAKDGFYLTAILND